MRTKSAPTGGGVGADGVGGDDFVASTFAVSRARTRSRSVPTIPGIRNRSISRGALFHLLSNRTYLGEIPHKDLSYPGAHPAIIGQALFDEAQALMASNTRRHKARPTRVSTMPLRGLVFDADQQPMCPIFGCGHTGQVYRYYVSAKLQQGARRPKDDDAIRRVPADAIEAIVLDRLQRFSRARSPALMDWSAASQLLSRVELRANELHMLVHSHALFDLHADVAAEIGKLARRLAPGERIMADQQLGAVRFVLPIRLKVRGGRSWLVTPDHGRSLTKAKADRALIGGLQNAHRFIRVMRHDGKSAKAPARAYDRQLCLIAFLAPDIQRAIFEGRQPPGFNLESLVHGSIPLAWADQRAMFGMGDEKFAA